MAPRPHAPRGWRTRLAPLLAAFAIGVASCIAPTLPVPPPADPQVFTPDASGTVIVRGKARSAEPESDVGVINYTLQRSCPPTSYCRYADLQIAHPDGSWELRVDGKKKDLLLLYQSHGNVRSPEVELIVP